MGCCALQAQPTFDLFAHCLNNKCARFWALPGKLQKGAEALDAFANDRNWKQGLPYIFPPVQIIDRVLRKLQDEHIRALLVVPKWTGRPWWGLFRPMAKVVLELGKTDDVLIPGPAMTQSTSKKLLPPGLLLMALVEP